MQGPDFIDLIIRLQDNRIEDQRCDISTFSKVRITLVLLPCKVNQVTGKLNLETLVERHKHAM